MPVGATAAATAGANLASGAMSASASNKASKQQAKAAKKALQFQERQYDTTLAMQRPSYQLGQAAQGIYASALGLPGFSLMQYGYPGYQDPFATQQQQGQAANQQRFGNGAIGNIANGLNGEQRDMPQGPGGQPGLATYQGAPNGQSLQQSNDATLTSILGGSNIPDLVRAQPGYQTQLQTGLDAARSTAAASGMSRSGAAMKGLSDYAQNTFGNYWDKWLGGIGTLAGYGQNAANQITATGQQTANNSGNITMQNGQNQAAGTMGAANAWAEGLGGAAGALSAYPWGSTGSTAAVPHSTGSYAFPGF